MNHIEHVAMLEQIIAEKDAVIDVLMGISGPPGRVAYILQLNTELAEKLDAANKTIEQMRADGINQIESEINKAVSLEAACDSRANNMELKL